MLAMSAEPIANTDVLCFGLPDVADQAVPAGAFHPARPCATSCGAWLTTATIWAFLLWAEGSSSTPAMPAILWSSAAQWVSCRAGRMRTIAFGRPVVLVGGATGRDGLHGALMSSAILDRKTVEGSTVQIGSHTGEATARCAPRLRDERLYSAITIVAPGGYAAPWEKWRSTSVQKSTGGRTPEVSGFLSLGDLAIRGAGTNGAGSAGEKHRSVIRDLQ